MTDEVKLPRGNSQKVDLKLAVQKLIDPLYTIRQVIDPKDLQFEIVQDPEKLSVPCEPWLFDSRESLEQATKLEEDMMKFLDQVRGYGLAHNQIGGNKQVIAIRSLGCLFNPKIVFASDDLVSLEEGCLSFPALYVKIKRPSSIRVRFQIANSRTVTERFEGLTARIIQHEIDHINGQLFYDKASKLHREQAFRKQRTELKKIKGDK